VRDAPGVAHLMTAAVTGHGALTTFHAATAEIAYGRIAHLMQLAVHGLPDRDLIRAAFPVVVRLDHRKVTSILAT
jgi:type IV secretory pathway ATPase VirB11/archaellum biosynthesis ATPase